MSNRNRVLLYQRNEINDDNAMKNDNFTNMNTFLYYSHFMMRNRFIEVL